MGLRFGGMVKVKILGDPGPRLVYRTCCGIGHERMGKCGDRLPRCMICAGPHKVENHQCGVSGCHKRPGKICMRIKIQCANCGGSHPTDLNRCIQRHKAEKDARKNKTIRKGKRKIAKSTDK